VGNDQTPLISKEEDGLRRASIGLEHHQKEARSFSPFVRPPPELRHSIWMHTLAPSTSRAAPLAMSVSASRGR